MGSHDVLIVHVVEAWERSDERLAAARRGATVRFGPPGMSPEMEDALSQEMPPWWQWAVPRSRIEAAFEWLEEFADRAVAGPLGWWDQAVFVTCSSLLWLRDPVSGKLLPRQHSKHKEPVFWTSSIDLTLQATSLIKLQLVLPFEEPDEDARRYLRELRPHLPVDLEPGYLNHHVPRADLTKYERRKIPLHWLDSGGRSPVT